MIYLDDRTILAAILNEATAKIAETIKAQSTSMQNANYILEDLLKLANQLM